MKYYIEVVSKLGKHIRITKNHWKYIINKHESVKSLENQIKDTLTNPYIVRLSKEDKSVHLYYSKYKKYYLCVVCKHLNSEGFIIIAYLTDNIKKGEIIYETNKNILR